jgi:hypothetical protein
MNYKCNNIKWALGASFAAGWSTVFLLYAIVDYIA